MTTDRQLLKNKSKGKPDTAGKIYQAADALFCEAGYSGVSIRDIAQRAGVNKALVFYHFGNKDELFAKVLERYYSAHIGALSTAYEGEGSQNQRLHRVLDAYLDFMAQNIRYARLIQRQVSSSEADRVLIERNLKPLFDWLQDVLLEVAPRTGPRSVRQFYVTFSAIVINYFTYAPILEVLWDEDPLTQSALDERREHVHWLVDVLLEAMNRE